MRESRLPPAPDVADRLLATAPTMQFTVEERPDGDTWVLTAECTNGATLGWDGPMEDLA